MQAGVNGGIYFRSVYLTGKLTTRSPLSGEAEPHCCNDKSARRHSDSTRPTIISTRITRLM